MIATRARLIAAFCLVTALLPAGCGDAPPAPAEAPLYTRVEVNVGAVEGGSRVTLDGVVFEVSFDVAITTPGVADSHVQINGTSHWSFAPGARQPMFDGRGVSVADGHLRIGDVDHGPIAPGDVVKVTPGEVLVERAGS